MSSGREISAEGVIGRNRFLIAVSAAYLAAAVSPLWGLAWGTMAAAVWSGVVLVLLLAGSWRMLRAGGPQSRTDFEFIVPLILAVNLFASLLGPDRAWLQPMAYLVVALCALYFSIGFNLSVAGLIFGLEFLNAVVTPDGLDLEKSISLLVFGAYLVAAALVLGRLFQSEYRKRERAVKAVKRLQEGALSLDTEDTPDPTVGHISPVGKMGRLLDQAATLDRALEDLLETARSAIPSENALLFMPESGGDGLFLRLYLGGAGIIEDCTIPAGQGLVGWVAKEKKPLVTHGKARGIGYVKNEESVRSLVAAPIMNGGYLEGVIVLDSSQPDAFTDVEKDVLERFAGIALYLLQNARQYQQADHSARNFGALHKISSELSSTLDLGDILERLATLSKDILPYDNLTIALTEAGGKVRFRTIKGYGPMQPPADAVAVEGSLLGWIVENRQPLSFSDLDQRTDKLPIFPVKDLQASCRSFLGIPLVSHDEVLGLFTLSLREPDAITGYQQHVLSIIANQVAVNIANAKLHYMMQQMATTDGLTGLINHRHFQEKADAEFARVARYPGPLSILLLDIDHFKKVNDTYGHPVGDAVLKRVSKILKDTVRDSDIAARYGGEEFVALLTNTDEKGAMQMAERIRVTIEKSRFLLDGKNIPITVSVGCASHPVDAGDKAGLIAKADQALYWSKGHGRNRCTPSREVGDAAPEKH
ncbi:MAG: diguanylate cyclase [Nitrospirae bacterium]|nr:diguanylate cyclase [Nitrospirota bacterium]MBI5694157.1 diguanylate cyclase [Nitrospirota bacterium]